MEIHALEIDFDRRILKINGKPALKPVIVTLPGEEGWPLKMLFSCEGRRVPQEECDKLEVIYSAGD